MDGWHHLIKVILNNCKKNKIDPMEQIAQIVVRPIYDKILLSIHFHNAKCEQTIRIIQTARF